MQRAIEYRLGNDLDLDAMIALYVASTLGERRPVAERERMAEMLRHANLVVTAWEGALLVGISRCVTDFVWTTYLSDLAVRRSHQRQGIGLELIRRTREAAPRATLLLLAAPAAVDYYPHIGFERMPQAWWLRAGDALAAPSPKEIAP
jgi:ribosomal protein S18 acetylase RimI-like enzyme